MDPCNKFTEDEDMALWRIAMKLRGGSQKLGKAFKDGMKTERSVLAYRDRFRHNLLPHLPNTKFHPETKLQLCQKYRFPVDESFLKELKKGARVQLDKHGLVKNYELKANCRKNQDIKLKDEDFIKLMSLVGPRKNEYSSEEDAEICKYVLEYHETYTRGSVLFWNELSQRLNRTSKLLLTSEHGSYRFTDTLSKNLHMMQLSVEEKLKLYKSCKITVAKEYLNELRKHADLETDRKGYISEYKLKEPRAGKRKNTEESGGRAKRARRNAPESDAVVREEEELTDEEVENARTSDPREAAENETDGEEPIVDDVPVGQSTRRISIVLKQEWDHDHEELQFFEEPNMSTVDLTPAAVRHPKVEVASPVPVLYAENEVEFVAEEEVQERESENQCADNEVEFAREEVVEQDENRSIEKMKEIMQNVEEVIRSQEASRKMDVLEMKKDLEMSFEAKLLKMKAELEVSFETKMMRMMSQGMKIIQNDLRTMRNENNLENPKAPSASNTKKYLLNLKNLVISLGSSETESIEQKIETKLQNIPENDEKSLPILMLNNIFEVALDLIK